MAEVKTKSFSVKMPKMLKTAAPDLLSMALWFIFSFAATKTMLFGKTAPFGVAAAAASNRNSAVSAALGAVVGYIFSENPENSLRHIAAVLIVFGTKLVVERFEEGDMVSVLIAGGATAFSSFGYAAATVISGYSSVMAFAETVLAAGSAYFFRRAGNVFEHGKTFALLSGSDRACVIMTASVTAAALASVSVGKLNIGSIAAGTIILVAAAYGKESGGAVAGISAGTAVSFTTGNFGGDIAGYALGGLLGGVFSPFGKIGCASAFVAVKIMVCLLETAGYPDYVPVYESLIAAGIFMVIPVKTGKNFLSLIFRNENTADSVTVKELVLSKIGRAADGLLDIAEATKKVAASVARENTKGMNTVLNLAAERSCRTCAKSTECWQSKYQETIKEFYEIGKAVKEKRKPCFSDEFYERCAKRDALFNDTEKEYKLAAEQNSAERKIKNIREVVTDQFEGTALLLRDIAADAATVKSVDKKLSAGVKKIFEARNIPIFSGVCYYTADGCVNIEISGAKERIKKADIPTITEELSDLCECDLAKPVKRDTENARRLVFCEKPLMTAEFGTVSVNAKGEKFCGDCSEFFIDQYGCANMILSDGMGSGEHAALDSMMAAGLVSRMIKAGFRFGPAIKLVNSALLLKSEHESLATVDAFSINLYTGSACFYKAGAEASFVLKNGHVSKVESVSFPVGILGGAEYEQNQMHLGIGDIVVLVTDGVTVTGSEWVPSELKSLSEKSAEEIAEGISGTAFKRRTDGRSDDITVAVAKIVSGY